MVLAGGRVSDSVPSVLPLHSSPSALSLCALLPLHLYSPLTPSSVLTNFLSFPFLHRLQPSQLLDTDLRVSTTLTHLPSVLWTFTLLGATLPMWIDPISAAGVMDEGADFSAVNQWILQKVVGLGK